MSEERSGYKPRRATAVRIGLVLIGLSLLGGAILFVRNYEPTVNSFYPGCIFHRTTGLHCTGCGLTRSLHAALNLQFQQSLAYHPLTILIVPFLLYNLAETLWYWLTKQPAPRGRIKVGGRGWAIVFVVVIAFTILRNIPAYPFNLLAPHEVK